MSDRNVESQVLVGVRSSGSDRDCFPDRRANHGSINFQVEIPRVAQVRDLPDQRQDRGDDNIEFWKIQCS